MNSTLRQELNTISPLKDRDMYITDGGLETTLVFHHGLDLPHFAAFHLLNTSQGYNLIRDYYHRYAALAHKYRQNFILESPTWRANPDWGRLLGYSTKALDQVNRQAIEMMQDIKMRYQSEECDVLISGCVGPRGDGYSVTSKMSPSEAAAYHLAQVESFSKAGVDMVTGVTMTYAEEALGLVEAAAKHQVPAVISFTLETDGKLPSGQNLKEAIAQIDAEATQPPAYFMINCAHPQHFNHILENEVWLQRIQGIRANASTKSHEELDESLELDEGDPRQFAEDYVDLRSKLNNLRVIGGCCGTDHRHIDAICHDFF